MYAVNAEKMSAAIAVGALSYFFVEKKSYVLRDFVLRRMATSSNYMSPINPAKIEGRSKE